MTKQDVVKVAVLPKKLFDAPHLLTVEYYVDELYALIAHFKLDWYYVYGNSWGSMLAQEFAVTNP